MELHTALLGLIATMIGGGVWTIKALMHRSDRMIEARDQQIGRSLDALSKAVDAFRSFEQHEQETHGAILAGLDKMNDSLQKMNTSINKLAP